MTLIQRIRSFLSSKPFAPIPQAELPASTVQNVSMPMVSEQSLPRLPVVQSVLSSSLAPLPDWLVDEESLRDEGVLFGLSMARPDGKIAQIRAYFSQQASPLEEQIEQYTEKIGEFNLFIEQRENRLLTLNDQLIDLRDRQPMTHSLMQHLVGLMLLILMSVGNFCLISETLQPVFANQWIAVGVFLAGMFGRAGDLSVFQETHSKPTGHQFVADVSLPLTAALFVCVSAWQMQSAGQTISLSIFIFCLFLVAGRFLLTTVAALQIDQSILANNRQLLLDKAQKLPLWKINGDQLTQEIDAFRAQKWPIVTMLNHAQAELSRLHATRDTLINLFLSEFELARSLRDQLTEQQRKVMMNYE